MKKRILTIGSANMDFVMNVQQIPLAGQTISDPGSYRFIPGGKSANSAVAVSRLGGESIFCTRLGNDANGAALRAIYNKEKLDTRFVTTDPTTPTGLAAIMVEPSGQNRIIVFPGSNDRICRDDIESAMLSRPDALLMQMEIPADAVITAAGFASQKDIPIIIDAGPAKKNFPLDRLPKLKIFSPNETETETFTGITPDSPENCLRAAMALSRLVDAEYYVIKLGDRGCYIYDGKYYHCLPAYDTHVVDTTAAGDAFTAALALEYLRSGDIVRAGKFANAVGAITVSSVGALPSIPTESDVAQFLRNTGEKL